MLLHCSLCPPETHDRLLNGSNLQLLHLLSEVKNMLITIYDRMRDEYPFRSKHFGDLLDTHVPRGVEPGSTDHFYKTICPDDLPFVKQMEAKACDFLQKLTHDERAHHHLVCEFRMKNRKGGYSRFVHLVSVFEWHTNGEIRGLFICSELVDEKPRDNVCRSYIVNRKTGKFICLSRRHGTHTPQRLSACQRRILALIAQGKDSPTIGSELFISNSTVNNHRCKILEKTGTDNCTQAVLYCKSLGDI